MSDEPYRVISADDVPERLVVDGTLRWKPLRRELGVRAFGVNAYVADAGQDVIEEHDEVGLDHEELYVVVRGRATFRLDGAEHDVAAGGIVFLRDPAVRRHAVACEDATLVLAVGAPVGAPYTVSEWEQRFFAESA